MTDDFKSRLSKMWHSIIDKFYGLHDRSDELREAAPVEVRRASHELSNETMKVKGTLRRESSAMRALTRHMREERDCR